METIDSRFIEDIYKVGRGSRGLAPPDANRIKRSQIKRQLLLFEESDFFEASLFFFFSLETCYLFFCKSRNMHF